MFDPSDHTTGARPRLLDLFCCGGGAGMGYHHAGFDVYGVDNTPQPHYPFAFHHGDAIQVLIDLVEGRAVEFIHPDGRSEFLVLADFAAAHSSPPCQENTRLKNLREAQGKALKKNGGDMIPITRDSLIATGLPYVIENVEGAELVNPMLLCGSMFPSLRVTDETGVRWLQRHRLFESNSWLLAPSCAHKAAGVRPLGVYYKLGDNVPSGGQTARTLKEAQELMGIRLAPVLEAEGSNPAGVHGVHRCAVARVVGGGGVKIPAEVIEEAARQYPLVAGEFTANTLRVVNREAFAKGAVWALREVRKAILDSAPGVNAELRHDGTPEPGMSAYVEGFRDALQAVDALIGEDHE